MAPKVHTGPKGGKYIIKKGRKVYLPASKKQFGPERRPKKYGYTKGGAQILRNKTSGRAYRPTEGPHARPAGFRTPAAMKPLSPGAIRQFLARQRTMGA